MRGLLRKDFYQVLCGGKVSLFLVLAFEVLYAFLPDIPIYGFLPVVMWGSVVNNLVFSRDETSGWLKFSRTLPVSGKEVVLSYYLFSWIGSAVVLILQILISLILRVPFESVLVVLAISFVFSSLYFSVKLAVSFRFGIQYERIFMIVMIALMCLLSSYMIVLGESSSPAPFLSDSILTSIAILIICLAGSVFSYLYSVRVYNQRRR